LLNWLSRGHQKSALTKKSELFTAQRSLGFTTMLLEILNYTKQRAIWSWEGSMHVLITEKSVYQWVVTNVISFIAAMALPISTAERLLLIMRGILILAMECMNTAIERVVDDISGDKRKLAKQAKDTATAAVALSAFAVGLAWIVIVFGILW